MYTVITKHAKGGGYCPDFVLRNETTTEECNKQPCGKLRELINLNHQL